MVPSDWKIASLNHTCTSHKVGWFKRIYVCLCGASAWSLEQLYQVHYKIEMETRQWLQTIEQQKTQRGQLTKAQREENLAKYEEFKKSLQQNSSPDSASFYE